MKRIFVLLGLVGAFLLAGSAQTLPQVFAGDGSGKYLGDFSANPYAPNSISNPFGQYGNRFSPDSVNNPFGTYGSPFSPYSATNPYAVQPPIIVAPPAPLVPMAPVVPMPAMPFTRIPR
jgi:hypothetical protein